MKTKMNGTFQVSSQTKLFKNIPCFICVCLFFLYRSIGLHPDPLRFGIFFAVVFASHVIGELLTLVMLGVIQNPNIVQSGVVLLNSAGVVVGAGLVR